MAYVNDLERIRFSGFLKDKSREKFLLDKDILQIFVLQKRKVIFKWQKCNYRKMGAFSSCWFFLPLNSSGSFILSPKWQKRCRNSSPLQWKKEINHYKCFPIFFSRKKSHHYYVQYLLGHITPNSPKIQMFFLVFSIFKKFEYTVN